MVPFPDPELVTEHQDWSQTTVHDAFDVTVNEVDPAAEVTLWVGGATDRDGAAPACVTVTTMGVSPETVTVILAVLTATELAV
jgi:hypothetical protein